MAGGVAGLGTALFVIVRLAVVGHLDAARLVMAERPYVDVGLAPKGLPVLPRNGYDGQFFYRLALDPGNLHRTAYGIHLDTIFRLQRIGYPFLAWLLSLGHHRWVPVTLLVVNVLAMAVIGALGGAFARGAHRHALWGLLLAGYFGFVFSVARDLAEPTAAAFLLGGLLALRRGRPVPGAVLFACGSLTRETVLVPVAVLLLCRLVAFVTGRARPGITDAAWVVPIAAFAAWQVAVHVVVGQYPILTDATDNSAGPLVPLVHSVDTHLRSAASLNPDSLIWVVEMVVLTVFVLAGLTALRSTTAPVFERLVFVAYLLELFFLSASIWNGTVDLRSLDEVYLLAVVLLFGAPRRNLVPMATVMAPIVVVVAGHRTVSL